MLFGTDDGIETDESGGVHVLSGVDGVELDEAGEVQVLRGTLGDDDGPVDRGMLDTAGGPEGVTALPGVEDEIGGGTELLELDGGTGT